MSNSWVTEITPAMREGLDHISQKLADATPASREQVDKYIADDVEDSRSLACAAMFFGNKAYDHQQAGPDDDYLMQLALQAYGFALELLAQRMVRHLGLEEAARDDAPRIIRPGGRTT